MTINVALKCADGIVLAADSLMTLKGEEGTVMLPYHQKLFPLGEFPAGVMINGKVSSPVTTVKDLIFDFTQNQLHSMDLLQYDLQYLTEKLCHHLNAHIRPYLNVGERLEVIVAGYSRGKQVRRFGEMYSSIWPKLKVDVKSLYPQDTDFGIYYGGARNPLDRFRYGFDLPMLHEMWKKRDAFFKDTADYIIEKLREEEGVNIPENISISAPSLANNPEQWKEYNRTFDVYSLISNYDPGESRIGHQELLEDVKRGSKVQYNFPDRFFSLQMGIDLCFFFMMCAYTAHNFTRRTPEVGSEMNIATITRNRGFEYILEWQPVGVSTLLK